MAGRTGRRGAGARPDDPPLPQAESHARSADPDADPETVARSLVLRRLSAAPQTRAQLDDALRRRDVPADVRERVLDRFGEVGLIDDAMFAKMWVESRHTGRGLARRALAHELRRRGVEPNLVDEAVAELPAEQEEETARALVARRLPSTRGLEPRARLRRLAGLLARKGYPAGLSYRIVREALEQEGVPERDLPHSDDW